jgi:hypothetical protein
MAGSLAIHGSVPDTDDVYVNCEAALGHCLQLLADRSSNRGFFIRCREYDLSARFVLHLTRLAAYSSGEDCRLHWHTGYDCEDFVALGGELRRFLAERWLRLSDGVDPSSSELIYFDVEDSTDVDRYVDVNLLPLLGRASHSRLFVVIEIRAYFRPTQSIVRLAERLLDRASSGSLAIFFLCDDKTEWRSRFDKVDVDPALVKRLPKLSERLRAAPVHLPQALPGGGGIVQLLHPLIMLNQAAQTEALSYLVNHQGAPKDLDTLIDGQVLQRYVDGSVGVTRRAVDLSATLGVLNGMFRDVVPNGAKILSFQPPGRLVEQDTPLSEVEKSLTASTALIDLFAQFLGTKRHPDALAELDHLSLDWQRAFNRQNAHAARILLSYFSQLLMTPHQELGHRHFKVMEQLTYGFCHFTVAVDGGDDLKAYARYESARWLKNLADLYERAELKKSQVSVPPHKVEGIYADGVAHLAGDSPRDLEFAGAVFYTRAWHLVGADRRPEAREEFLAGAFRYRKMALQHGREDLRYQWSELLLLALACEKEISLGAEHLAMVGEFMAAYGVLFTIAEIQHVIHNHPGGHISLFPAVAAERTVNIYFCNWDLYAAVMIAGMAAHGFNLMPRLILVRERSHLVAGLALDSAAHIVLAAPDTPDLGPIVGEALPELERLYQLNLTRKFHCHTEIEFEGRHLNILAGCGLGSILDAWDKVVRAGLIKKGKMPMLESLLSHPLFQSLLGGCGSAVTGAVVEGIADRLWPSRENLEIKDKLGEIVTILKQAAEEAKKSAPGSVGDDPNPASIRAGTTLIGSWLDGRPDARALTTLLLRIFSDGNLPAALAGLEEYTASNRVSLDEQADICRVLYSLCRKQNDIENGETARMFADFQAGFAGLQEEIVRNQEVMRRRGVYPAWETGVLRDKVYTLVRNLRAELG